MPFNEKLEGIDPTVFKLSKIFMSKVLPQTELSILFLVETDLDRKFFVPPFTLIGGQEKELCLREIIRRLEV